MKTVVLNWSLSRQGCLCGVSDTLPDHPPTPVWEESLRIRPRRSKRRSASRKNGILPHTRPKKSTNLLHGVPRALKRR